MKIGTDISLAVCRTEGYLVMEYAARKLFTKGKLNKDCEVHFTRSNPHEWYDNGKPMIHVGDEWADLYILDTWRSWNDVVELFETRKEAISDYADFKNCPINFDNPTVYDFLNLADSVDSYMGLE